ncbi:MAG: InlB B-repeat-containing protein [Oscillospiraceae bacterium]|nr:InlB B-repeat-containing protein [Oscillospiraceae bacterium]
MKITAHANTRGQARTSMKITALTLALAMTLAMLPGLPGFPAPSALMADASYYSGPTGGHFIDEIAPPQESSTPISNRAELEAIRNNLSGRYHLVADIDLSGGYWDPIGDSSSNAFTGNLDGQGYVIRNMTIVGNHEYAGLFGYIAGSSPTIRNIGLENTYIEVSTLNDVYAGGICGYAKVLSSSIRNCYNTGEVVAAASSNIYVGGISGYSSGFSIRECYNMANISGNAFIGNNSFFSYVGGISGYLAIGSTSNCHNMGNISGTANSPDNWLNFYVGGICGYKPGTSSITDSYNTGRVSVNLFGDSFYEPNIRIGGILAAASNVAIRNCFNQGTVAVEINNSLDIEPTVRAGGICGVLGGSNSGIVKTFNTGFVAVSSNSKYGYLYAAGICASFDEAIEDCYNKGEVRAFGGEWAYAGVGGITSDTYDSASIVNCYNTGHLGAGSGTNGESHVGGICLWPPFVANAYWNSDSEQVLDYAPQNPKRGIFESEDSIDTTTSLNTPQMKLQSNFVGFDFDDVWGIDPLINNGFPFLRNSPNWYSGGGYSTPGPVTPTPPIGTPPVTTTYTVNFYSDGGTQVDPYTGVESGSTIDMPLPLPEKPDFAFVGWFKDPQLTERWVFEHDTVTSNITLYASWGDIRHTGIDYNYEDLIVPGSINGTEVRDQFHINLRRETFLKPDSYTIKSYSIDGGNKWKGIKKGNEFDNGDKKGFVKFLGKNTTLHLSDKEIDKATKKPEEGDTRVTFPTIEKRAKAPRCTINYLLAADMTGKTTGEWMLSAKKVEDVPLKAGIEIAASGSNPKEVGEMGYGRFYFPDDPDMRIGIPVEVSPNGKAETFVYFVRTAPRPNEDGVSYTAGSKPRKTLATSMGNSVKSIGKAPSYSIKNDTIKLKKGDMIFAGSESELGVGPEIVSGSAGLTQGKLLYAKDNKTEISLADYPSGSIMLWKAPKLKKAVSRKLLLTP